MENKDINNEEIFDLIKNHKFDQIYLLIKNKKIKNLDIRDSNFNYFIQYIVNYNQVDIIKLILDLTKNQEIKIRLDILDTDGRSILYNCIKYNYSKIIIELIEYNKETIGISILDIKDRLGYTALHYAVIFNNFDSFKILLDSESDPYVISNDGNNVFLTCLLYKRNQMLEYLLEKNYPLNFVSQNGETLLQLAVNYQNTKIITKLLEKTKNLNNITSDYGLNVFHQSIILDNHELFLKLLDKPIDVNMPDFYGNSPLHYIFIDKRLNYLEPLVTKSELRYTNTNINGDTPLHILLDSDILIDEIDDKLLEKIIMETDLNIQNNQGITCLMKIVNNNLIQKFKDVLLIKPLNFFIEDNNFSTIKITDDIIDLIVDSFYNQIKHNKKELILDWEKWCATDTLAELKKLVNVKTDIKGENAEEICKSKIRQIIQTEKRTLPKMANINLTFDSGIFTNFCYYTGSPIDILFGLVLLHNEFSSNGLGIILDYPLTINDSLEVYYKKLGIDYPYKLDFSNIEIIWSYQKIFYPSYFDDEIKKQMTESKYIVIPIGIETSIGAHANILFWDIKNKTVERFEPNGANYPIGLNYNPELLDSYIESKLKQFDSELVYYPPYKFLPTISFQILENLETPKCKKIGDPNGFCGVWCTWWVYQRMLNINNPKLNINNLASELIKFIKLDNNSFKSLIRNFSKKISEIRDVFLKKQNLDINDWIVGKYDSTTLDKLEKEIFKSIKH